MVDLAYRGNTASVPWGLMKPGNVVQLREDPVLE